VTFGNVFIVILLFLCADKKITVVRSH